MPASTAAAPRRNPLVLVSAAAAVVVAVAWGINNQMSLQSIRAANAAVSLAGRHAVVVGGTSGIGHGIAVRLAKGNASVTIVGRDATRGAAVVDEMKATGGTGSFRFLPCDAFLLENVRKTAEVIRADTPNLDILVVSQGMATLQGRTETAEGIDQKLALHYYSRMGFVGMLLPSLRAQAAADPSFSPRVLSVLAAGAHSAYPHYKEDPEVKEHYSLANAAASACLYNDVAADALSRDPANKGIVFIHSAPGFIATNWGTEMPTALRWLIRGIQVFGRSIHDCAEFMLNPVLDPSIKGGFILSGAEAQRVSKTSAHEDALAPVMAHTKEVLGKHGISL